MERKPIQVDEKTHEIIRLEALRQSFKTGNAVSMGEVLAPFAEKLNKRRKFLPDKNKAL